MLQLMLLGLFVLSKPRVPLDFQSSAYCNDDNDDADDNNFKNNGNGNGNASDNDNYDDDTKYDDDDDEDLSSACYCFPPRPLLGDREWNMGQTWHLDIVPHQGLFSEQCSHITPGGWGWGWQGGLGDDENNYYDFYHNCPPDINFFPFLSTSKSENMELICINLWMAQIIMIIFTTINDPEEMPASVIVRVVGSPDCLLTRYCPRLRPDKTPFAAKISPQIVKIFHRHCRNISVDADNCWDPIINTFQLN